MVLNIHRNKHSQCFLSLHKTSLDPVDRTVETCAFRHKYSENTTQSSILI